MTTAVLEAPVEVKQTREQIEHNYRCPIVRSGRVIVFYDRGNTGAEPHIGFVTKPGARLIECWVPTLGGGRMFHPRHVSDPKLVNCEPELREDGTWDFTDHDKDTMEQMAEWERRFKAMERAFSSDGIDGGRGVLLSRAKTVGLTGYSKMSNEDLLNAVEAAEAEAESKRRATIEAGKV